LQNISTSGSQFKSIDASVINFFIGVLSSLPFRLFSENILHKRVASFRQLIIKYLSSTVDLIVAEQIYTTPVLRRQYERMFIINSIIFTYLKSRFTQLNLLNFLCKSDYFPRRYKIKRKWAFLV